MYIRIIVHMYVTGCTLTGLGKGLATIALRNVKTAVVDTCLLASI